MDFRNAKTLPGLKLLVVFNLNNVAFPAIALHFLCNGRDLARYAGMNGDPHRSDGFADHLTDLNLVSDADADFTGRADLHAHGNTDERNFVKCSQLKTCGVLMGIGMNTDRMAFVITHTVLLLLLCFGFALKFDLLAIRPVSHLTFQPK